MGGDIHKTLWLLVTLSLLGGLSLALYWPYFSGTKGAALVEEAREVPYLEPSSAVWQGFLDEVVDDSGWVNYAAALKQRHMLQAFLDEVARATPVQFPSDENRLAFYLNAYNAMAIEGVLRHWPIASVDDVGILHQFFRERVYEVAGCRVSLHGFETRVIRNYDPLLHFALNCASTSCPKLAAVAYDPAILSQQLQERTRVFLADPENNHYDGVTHTWHLSQIFSWYADDFGGEPGVRDLLSRFTAVQDQNATLVYLSYNWSLNESRKIP